MTRTVKNDVPFAAGVVGSLPRPKAVIEMLPQTPSPEASRSPNMDAAARFAIALQETAGLDQVSDGEWRRHAYTHIIADIASGFSADLRENPRRWGISITEPMVVKRPGLIAEEAKFLVKHTSKMTKVCLPSPYLLGVRLWEKDVSKKAYPTRDKFIDALVPILRNELIEVAKTGVTTVQIDEPHLCVLVDPSYRNSFDNAQYEMDLAAAKINEIIHGIKGVRLALHLCRRNWGRKGWGAEGGYEPIIDTMKKIKVDQYVMEFSIPVAGDVAILKQMPEDSLIGLGCVECRFEKIDTPEEIVARVEKALQYVEPQRISLNPDCGFAPGLGIPMDLDEPYQKLKNEAEAARRLREKYA
ncbi:MAG: cobalamin-independent methionine synthase II family protein [SAR202 cluster bacterium]|nr:cobalamin-independent methionine synthase II family protein [SAR202 cluster bacterium]